MRLISGEINPGRTRTAKYLLAVIIGLAVAALAFRLTHRGVVPTPSFASVQEQQSWQPIVTRKLAEQSITFQNYAEFPPSDVPDLTGVWYRVTGRFIGSANSQMVFFDRENYQRWVKREPPFPLAAFKPMQPVSLEVSTLPGFVIIDPPPEAPGLDISSVSAALLSFVRMQSARRQESQATVELSVITEAFTTPSGAEKIRKGIAHEH